MLSDRLSVGVRVGTLCGAMTAGALLGLGWRHQQAVAPFEFLGRAMASRLGALVTSIPVALATGVVVHFLWMILWGICFTFLALRLRGVALLAAAILQAAFVGALAATVAPGALGAAAMAGLSIPQTLFLLTLLALCMAAGMRLARTSA